MIKRLTVRKLNGRSDFDLCFNEDMNILTGKNGCGKTTLLKLAWYMISGNLDRVLAEIDFESVNIETDSFSLSAVVNKTSNSDRRSEWRYTDSEGNVEIFPNNKSLLFGIEYEQELLRLRERLVAAPGASVFFPTFRRIEGGFAMSKAQSLVYNAFYDATTTRIEDAMTELAERLSVGQHRLVTSISTSDIVDIITKLVADIDRRINRANSIVSNHITSMISEYNTAESSQNEGARLSQAVGTLDRIQKQVSENSDYQAKLFQPLDVLDRLVTQVFKNKGIDIAPNIIFGNTSDVVPSNALSAGEKQMLSFMAYNALAKNNVIFIDEPEISLHVDWQRTLFSILESQGTNNQFIVATHSPFIYSKYADKELMLDKDRGE